MQVEESRQAAADALSQYSLLAMTSLARGVTPARLRLQLLKEMSGMDAHQPQPAPPPPALIQDYSAVLPRRESWLDHLRYLQELEAAQESLWARVQRPPPAAPAHHRNGGSSGSGGAAS
eukprot:SM008769S23439  [mRNA]  locus=s8769:106:624:+ [translate_table: standard]